LEAEVVDRAARNRRVCLGRAEESGLFDLKETEGLLLLKLKRCTKCLHEETVRLDASLTSEIRLSE
jgi:hypothetical protein